MSLGFWLPPASPILLLFGPLEDFPGLFIPLVPPSHTLVLFFLFSDTLLCNWSKPTLDDDTFSFFLSLFYLFFFVLEPLLLFLHRSWGVNSTMMSTIRWSFLACPLTDPVDLFSYYGFWLRRRFPWRKHVCLFDAFFLFESFSPFVSCADFSCRTQCTYSSQTSNPLKLITPFILVGRFFFLNSLPFWLFACYVFLRSFLL